ncbi:MAG: hypothetical protein ACRDY4_01625 [Acidimicrobiia bacterium]
MLWDILRVVIALVAAVTIYVVGAAVLRKFKIAPPDDPDPAELRPVDVRFRCEVCGAEVTMTVSASDEPEAPRHCREDMTRIV